MRNGGFPEIARRPVIGAFITIWSISLLLLFTVVARAAERQVLHGHVPVAVTKLNLQPMGRLPYTNLMHLAIGLPLRNKGALDTLLQQVYDPASTNYHHYLTTEQFTERFGPAEKDYQALSAFAEANGLTVIGTHPNRTLLDVKATVADIERVFHVTMRTYQHPTEARVFYAPDVEPSVDLAVPLLEIGGFNDFEVPHPLLRTTSRNNALTGTLATGSGPGGSYIGYDFRNAYVPG
ncbi:MAG TPA: protease pro-enzyme activation domain-containing protein, partial [Verrucomicrobiae bacterium]|nr:protease pro-enzyme activation domain-containing protein [Verrucomicrobiae bacterium]